LLRRYEIHAKAFLKSGGSASTAFFGSFLSVSATESTGDRLRSSRPRITRILQTVIPKKLLTFEEWTVPK
jgi:hypothetical protein